MRHMMRPCAPATRVPAPRVTASRVVLQLALLVACSRVAAVSQQPLPAQVASGLQPSESFVGSEPDGSKAVFAPQVVLGGTPLRLVPAAEAGACSAACRADPKCGWFNFCGERSGCDAVGNEIPALSQSQCLLMDGGNCTLVPPVAQRGVTADVDAVGGFPVRAEALPGLPGVLLRTAQGLVGGDFDCGSKLSPGVCTFASPMLASGACTNAQAGSCQAVVVYSGGAGPGCGGDGQLAVLKSANLAPSNAFMSPYVYTLERVEGEQTGGFLLRSETSLIEGPAASGAASGPAAAPAPGAPALPLADNSTEWLGCMVGDVPALVDGTIVTTVSGLASAEACCRACRADVRCNVWNYCPGPEGCSFEDLSVKVALAAQQCQLRFQQLVVPSTGGPPYMYAKGPAAGSFVAGAPLYAPAGPELPGFTRYVGGGLFGQPGFVCDDSLQPELQECTLAAPLPEVAARCSGDPGCSAILFKPLGTPGLRNATSILRSPEGANASLMVATPGTTVYLEDAAQQAGGDSGDSGAGASLSAGAIAGIAAGCAVAALAAAIGGWALARRRRRARAAGGAADASAKSGNGGLLPVTSVPGAGGNGGLGAPQASLRGTLGRPPEAAPATAASNGSNGSSQLVARYVLSRPPAASPFAARQSRMVGFSATPPSSPPWAAERRSSMAADPLSSASLSVGRSGRSAGGLSSPSQSGSIPQTPSAEHDLAEMMSELLQYRAAEDAAAVSLGAAAALGAPTSGGGGTTGTPRSGGSAASGASRASQSQALGSGALPDNLTAWLIEPEQVEYQRRPDGELAVLGEGASGRAIRAIFNDEPVAAKEVDVGKGLAAHEAFVTEAQRMHALRHPHIVTLFGIVLNPPKGVLVMELCEGRDLYSVLQLRTASGERLFGWWRHGARVAREVASAVNYLHAKSLTHMDIKSSNVLLTAQGAAKLSDWGSSKRHIEGALSTLPGAVGTFAWMAPEIIMGQRCTTSVDLYSFGVLLWEIVTGEKPRRGELRLPLMPEESPQEVSQLIHDCMALDPAARPTAKQLVQRLAAAPRHRPSGGGGGSLDIT